MDKDSQINSTLGAWRALTPTGKLAVLACLLAAFGLARQIAVSLLDLAHLPRVSEVGRADPSGNLIAYEQGQKRYASMVDGRSMFVKPPRPRVERVPVIPVAREPEPVETRPTTYAGPKIIAMVGDQVWFDDDTRLRVGESAGTLEVVSVQSPWSARVVWRGEEFGVNLFDRAGSAIPLLPLEGEDESAAQRSSSEEDDWAFEIDEAEEDSGEKEEKEIGALEPVAAYESSDEADAASLDEE